MNVMRRPAASLSAKFRGSPRTEWYPVFEIRDRRARKRKTVCQWNISLYLRVYRVQADCRGEPAREIVRLRHRM